jgi:hypothetical protein
MEDTKSFPGGMRVEVDSSSAVEGTKFLAATGERQRDGNPSKFFTFPLNTREHPDL